MRSYMVINGVVVQADEILLVMAFFTGTLVGSL